MGPPGVGKTAVVEGLAQRIAEGKVEGCGSVGGLKKQIGRSLLDHISSNLDMVSNQRFRFRPKKWQEHSQV